MASWYYLATSIGANSKIATQDANAFAVAEGLLENYPYSQNAGPKHNDNYTGGSFYHKLKDSQEAKGGLG